MGESYRPLALRVMAEHGADDGVWDPDRDHCGPVELERLGVSAGLVQRLKEWNGSAHEGVARRRGGA
ncbi:hypothetical protein Abr02nite_78320 [Paractinoplanes brasiliensis]|nr:hypothetical protein Abr02nite_78320 [Actinoplanes brasiliensis]